MQKEREIDLLDLIYYVLTKWKMLILAGVIGLVLVGGYKYYGAEQARKADPTEQASYKAAREKFKEKEEDLLELKGERTALQIQKDNIALNEKGRKLAGEKAGQLQNYLSESILMKINAGAAPKASRTYQVCPYSLLSAEIGDDLLSAYGGTIILDEEMLKKYSVPAGYINELVTVSADASADTVTVTAYGEDPEMAESLLADACAVLENRGSDLAERYQNHELKAVAETAGETVDPELAALQSARYDELRAYLEQAEGEVSYVKNKDDEKIAVALTSEDLDSALALYDADIETAESEVSKAKAALTAEAVNGASGLRTGIKYGIIGGVVFAILLAGIYFMIYVFDGKLHTVSELAYCYGMPLLAGLSAEFKGCALDKCFYRLRNKGAGTSNEVVLQTASVTVSRLLGEAKTVAVISSLDQEALEPVTSGLARFIPGVSFISVADTNLTAEAAEKLKAADAVIVYEKREVSRIREIEAELHQARLLEKNIIGCIAG